MAKITLSKALKVRKQLRNALDKFSFYGIYRRSTDPEPDYGEGGNFDSYFADYLELNALFNTLNTKIDYANTQTFDIPEKLKEYLPKFIAMGDKMSVRSLLNCVETLKHLESVNNRINEEYKKFKKCPAKQEWDEYAYNELTKQLGAYSTVNYTCDAPDVTDQLKALKKTIGLIEDKILELNNTITIELTSDEEAIIDNLI